MRRPLIVVSTIGIIAFTAATLFDRHRSGASVGVRFTEGRISGIAWAAPPAHFRGGAGTANAALLPSIPRDLVQRRPGDSSPAALRETALVRFVGGHVEDASSTMEVAARAARSDARLWSDAAALRVELWRRSGDSRAVLDALAFSDRALELEGNLPEALFNRALALEKLGLRVPAIRAYRRAALRDDDAKWRDESMERAWALHRPTKAALWSEGKKLIEAAAAGHDSATVKRLVAEYPQQARTWAEGEILSAWSDAWRAKNIGEAERLLSVAAATGEALRERSGESLLIDTVTAIQSERANVALVANAYDVYRRGRIALSRGGAGAAISDLDAAAALFERARIPMSGFAAYYAALARFESGDRAEALVTLHKLRSRVAARHFALQAHIDWEIGTVLGAQGEIYDSMSSYNAALSTFERLGETESAAQMRTYIAKSLNLLGDAGEAANVRQRVLQVASDSGSDRLLEVALGELARDEILAKRWDSARSIQAVAIADVSPAYPRRRFDILLWRALLARPIDLRGLDTALASITDARLHAEAGDDLRFAQAMAVRDRDPLAAVELLGESIAYAVTPGARSLTLPYLYLERARTWSRAKRFDEAIGDYLRSLDFFEERRGSIASMDYRDAFVGTASDAFDELLQLRAQRGEYDEAVNVAERRRGRVFLDSLGSSEKASPLPIAAIASRLPPDTRVLVYTKAGEAVLVTAIDRGKVATRRLARSAQWFASTTGALRQSLESGGDAASDAAQLSSVLSSDFASHKRVIVVADAPLNDVPFAMLRNAANRFLLEESSIVVAPSASVFVQAKMPPRPRQLRLLAVADPAFSMAAFPRLERLPEAVNEIHDIARVYANPILLDRDAATIANVERSLRDANVIHLATHAIANAADSSLSQLLLAADAQGSGACSLRRVSRMTLSRGSTVILAGCGTAVRDAAHGDLRDFANAFLASGAREVVATLWNVDDSTSHAFAVRFHRRLSAGMPAEEALRAAQLEMMSSRDPHVRSVRNWAPYQTYKTGL